MRRCTVRSVRSGHIVPADLRGHQWPEAVQHRQRQHVVGLPLRALRRWRRERSPGVPDDLAHIPEINLAEAHRRRGPRGSRPRAVCLRWRRTGAGGDAERRSARWGAARAEVPLGSAAGCGCCSAQGARAGSPRRHSERLGRSRALSAVLRGCAASWERRARLLVARCRRRGRPARCRRAEFWRLPEPVETLVSARRRVLAGIAPSSLALCPGVRQRVGHALGVEASAARAGLEVMLDPLDVLAHGRV